MKMKNFSTEAGLECARGIADWLYNIQSPHLENNASAGSYPWMVGIDGIEYPANNWNVAFGSLGLMAAYDVFGDEKYKIAALQMAGFNKSLQIFDPFKPEHYGAFREISPQTPWCYTRDALSVAWSFILLAGKTQDRELLERSRLWGEWFFRQGLDEEGWPRWGLNFEAFFSGSKIHMYNDILGSFQGGGLNYLYQMYKITGNTRWIGKEYVNIAEMLIKYIQQPDGLFQSVERQTKKPLELDVQGNLHRANDDFCSLGLLTAFKMTGNRTYLDAVKKFLRAVFERQQEDGSFDHFHASIPVVLNTVYEAELLTDIPGIPDWAVDRALERLLSLQSDGQVNRRMAGGIIEEQDGNYVGARASCYALMFLLKVSGGAKDYLAV